MSLEGERTGPSESDPTEWWDCLLGQGLEPGPEPAREEAPRAVGGGILHNPGVCPGLPEEDELEQGSRGQEGTPRWIPREKASDGGDLMCKSSEMSERGVWVPHAAQVAGTPVIKGGRMSSRGCTSCYFGGNMCMGALAGNRTIWSEERQVPRVKGHL